jgi:hypothetical protein
MDKHEDESISGENSLSLHHRVRGKPVNDMKTKSFDLHSDWFNRVSASATDSLLRLTTQEDIAHTCNLVLKHRSACCLMPLFLMIHHIQIFDLGVAACLT